MHLPSALLVGTSLDLAPLEARFTPPVVGGPVVIAIAPSNSQIGVATTVNLPFFTYQLSHMISMEAGGQHLLPLDVPLPQFQRARMVISPGTINSHFLVNGGSPSHFLPRPSFAHALNLLPQSDGLHGSRPLLQS